MSDFKMQPNIQFLWAHIYFINSENSIYSQVDLYKGCILCTVLGILVCKVLTKAVVCFVENKNYVSFSQNFLICCSYKQRSHIRRSNINIAFSYSTVFALGSKYINNQSLSLTIFTLRQKSH